MPVDPLSDRQRPPLILIIDDEESFRYILKKCLADVPCIIMEAEDGSAGIRITRDARPDLIFLDLSMPGRSGWQFMQDLAESETLAEIPIVVVTAQALSVDDRSHLDRSAHAVLLKSELSESTVQRVIEEVFPDSATRMAEPAKKVSNES